MSVDFDSDDIPSNPRTQNTEIGLSQLIAKRLSRRGVIGGLGAMAVTACQTPIQTPAQTSVTGAAGQTAPSGQTGAAGTAPTFGFTEIKRGTDGTHHVPPGYDADILLRWGDPLFEDSPEFDPNRQTPATQAQQFGYNNDFIGFVPTGADSGLLCVNHEYSDARNMFPRAQREASSLAANSARVETEIASQGTTIVALRRANERWQPDIRSPYNRRITAATPMQMTGPAAGHARLQTPADPSGRRVLGTIGNCAGGITPWGTYLTAEENINLYFGGTLAPDHSERENHARYGVPTPVADWHKYKARFDVGHAPHEANRFGWIVEIDPKDPNSVPKKRTALGRFKHEGAESLLAPDGRIVVYMGDDQRGDYLYKFVSRDAYDPARPNPDLLDEGTLYVARFDETGVDWLPLIWGQGPLTPDNGFASQADILITARLAADALGATPMDRPEDVQPHPTTGRVYVMLTNNSARSADLDAPLRQRLNAANPRANNLFGHIIEIVEPDGDFTATRSGWDFLVKCGDPDDPNFGAVWNPAIGENGWFTAPDNCAIDPSGRLWIATDGNPKSGSADGLWALETDGARRGIGRAFFRAPIGAEVCGPRFTPDGKTVFLAVQHPGDGREASFETPLTRWPDFDANVPPRPSIVAVYKSDGGVIGN